MGVVISVHHQVRAAIATSGAAAAAAATLTEMRRWFTAASAQQPQAAKAAYLKIISYYDASVYQWSTKTSQFSVDDNSKKS